MDIRPISYDDVGEFAAIWIPWLESMGRKPEAEDLEIMRDPGTYYRATGGEAFLATFDGETVGAVAVKGLGASGYEFCKLVVTEKARGHGAGRALVERCLAYSSARGGPALYLQSFKALDVALGLYERMGFRDAEPPQGMSVLARTEVIMAKRT
ncbi:MAG: GNAT family N-acetyltransferase [Pseudomonadota bacterium]|jgi:GNAT superfamily N-acetyltransferase